jgi:hypothetical protein
VELKIVAGDPLSYEVKVNGATLGSGTAATGTSDNVGLVGVGQGDYDAGSIYGRILWDDVALDDASYPGDSHITPLYITGNGTDIAWTGAYDKYDDYTSSSAAHDSGTTYANTSTNTNAETGSTADPTTTTWTSIPAVKALSVVIRGTSYTTLIKLRLRSGATASDNTSRSPASAATYEARTRLYTTDPATSAAWATTAMAGLEVGVVHANTTSRDARFTAGLIMVEYSTASLTSIKTVQGLAKASVKTMQGLAVASMKTLQGLA